MGRLGRPMKATVDYFPHDANASQCKTLAILFNLFGHEGISAWWQLLERLSSTNKHFLSLRNGDDLQYLAAIFHFQPEKLQTIFDKMADLDAIDPNLYSHGFIWCQNLVNRLEPVYKTRRQPLPTKPDFRVIEKDNVRPEKELILPENTQSKVKETKVKETKEVKEEKTGNETSLPLPQTTTEKTLETSEVTGHDKKIPFGEFQNVFIHQAEYDKLVTKYGEKQAKVMIETLSSYLKSKRKRYADHYATLCNWFRRDGVEPNTSGRYDHMVNRG